MSNTFLIVLLVSIVPIYPVFGSFLYDGSRMGYQGYDRTSILYEDEESDPFIDPVIGDTGESRSSIVDYIVSEGDTLSEISEMFDISPNSIRWANNLSSNVLTAGRKLIIPPDDGVIYTTKDGDTLDAISLKFATTSEKIKTANRLGDILPTGTMLFLPDGSQPVNSLQGVVHTLSVINPKGAGFALGHCTYYVAQHWPVTWRGNARNWYKNAGNAGFKTGQEARPGAIVVWYGPGYNLTYGHVGIVMSVNVKKGTMVVKDMNYAGLWKITTRIEKLKNKYIIGYIYNEKK